MEQSQSLTEKIPENPGTLGQGISTGQILAGKPDRSRQGVQHSHGFLQTPRTPAPDACKILRPRRASKGHLSRGRQRNREDISEHGHIETDARGRIPRRCTRYSGNPEGLGCVLTSLWKKYATTRSFPWL